jgi:phosphoribosylaminoimidazole carboxylase PurE protein
MLLLAAFLIIFEQIIGMNPLIGIIMGSDSDLQVMQAASEILKQSEIPHEVTVVSAHRTPHRMIDYAQKAKERGLKIIIAGAGGAAHLPGMVASVTTLPVIGVPIKSSNSIDGWDSVLSILQMPNGVPVATVKIECRQKCRNTSCRNTVFQLNRLQKSCALQKCNESGSSGKGWQNETRGLAK